MSTRKRGGRLSALAAMIPLTLGDVLVLAGFCAAVYGAWLTFGLGPTLIVSGGAGIWVGGVLHRGVER